MPEDGAVQNPPLDDEKNASLERVRAVGRTFADGVEAFRESIKAVHLEDGGIEAAAKQGGPHHNEENPSNAITRDNIAHQKDLDHMKSLLEASESRVEALKAENKRLQAESSSHAASADRATRLLNTIRVEYDRLRAETNVEAGQESAALAESVRLRSEIVEVERELQRVSARAEQYSRKHAEEKKKSSALERVCMGLRRRVAIAEEKAQDEKRVQEAILARELAESQLAEAKAEVERWRVRSAATEVTRERAEAAESSERVQRERIAILEAEIESREVLLRQGLAERKKLKEYMIKYENELEVKEVKLSKLRNWIKERAHRNERANTRRRHLDDVDDMVESGEETELGTVPSETLEKSLLEDNEISTHDWDHELLKGNETTEDAGEDSIYVEASPILREVEEANAQLQAALQDPEDVHDDPGDVDLLERVRRLEASFDALAHNRGTSPL